MWHWRRAGRNSVVDVLKIVTSVVEQQQAFLVPQAVYGPFVAGRPLFSALAAVRRVPAGIWGACKAAPG